jgi:pyridoxamine 5'-phosphate oxidase
MMSTPVRGGFSPPAEGSSHRLYLWRVAARNNPPMPDHTVPLREQDVDPDPLRQFAAWFSDAAEAGVRIPEAMAVATASATGVPTVRMVLLKGYDERGFVFFTHYESLKGRELEANPHAALLFYWDPLGRQVRLEGPAERTSREETAAYVRSRPPGSQLSALASPQSQVLASREQLERRVAELETRYRGEEPPLPEDWGGFRVRPRTLEFWQNREDRLHDRLRYTHQPDHSWRVDRLAP